MSTTVFPENAVVEIAPPLASYILDLVARELRANPEADIGGMERDEVLAFALFLCDVLPPEEIHRLSAAREVFGTAPVAVVA